MLLDLTFLKILIQGVQLKKYTTMIWETIKFTEKLKGDTFPYFLSYSKYVTRICIG